MRTSYRDIFLPACCQALLLANTSGLITVKGLVGCSLAGDKAFPCRRHCRQFSRSGGDSLGRGVARGHRARGTGRAIIPAAKIQVLNDLILFALMGVSSFASGVLIAAARCGSMNAVALPFIAVVTLATAWLATLRQRPATPRPRAPQRGW